VDTHIDEYAWTNKNSYRHANANTDQNFHADLDANEYADKYAVATNATTDRHTHAHPIPVCCRISFR
jgi:purine-nucleoside phosphorylase